MRAFDRRYFCSIVAICWSSARVCGPEDAGAFGAGGAESVVLQANLRKMSDVSWSVTRENKMHRTLALLCIRVEDRSSKEA
jgi:hypothetical protein